MTQEEAEKKLRTWAEKPSVMNSESHQNAVANYVDFLLSKETNQLQHQVLEEQRAAAAQEKESAKQQAKAAWFLVVVTCGLFIVTALQLFFR